MSSGRVRSCYAGGGLEQSFDRLAMGSGPMQPSLQMEIKPLLQDYCAGMRAFTT